MADTMSLDVPDPQVLVHFAGDPHFTEHHRLLLCKLGPGRWAACSPDHELEILDLNNRRHTVLGRRSPFPPHLADDVYAFDPLTRNELEALRRQAKTMSIVLGDADVEEIQSREWIFSDADSSRLGKQVPVDVVPNAVTLGNRGLVEFEGTLEGIEEVPSQLMWLPTAKRREDRWVTFAPSGGMWTRRTSASSRWLRRFR